MKTIEIEECPECKKRPTCTQNDRLAFCRFEFECECHRTRLFVPPVYGTTLPRAAIEWRKFCRDRPKTKRTFTVVRVSARWWQLVDWFYAIPPLVAVVTAVVAVMACWR